MGLWPRENIEDYLPANPTPEQIAFAKGQPASIWMAAQAAKQGGTGTGNIPIWEMGMSIAPKQIVLGPDDLFYQSTRSEVFVSDVPPSESGIAYFKVVGGEGEEVTVTHVPNPDPQSNEVFSAHGAWLLQNGEVFQNGQLWVSGITIPPKSFVRSPSDDLFYASTRAESFVSETDPATEGNTYFKLVGGSNSGNGNGIQAAIKSNNVNTTYATVQEAMAAAVDGDELILTGILPELLIRKSIRVTGNAVVTGWVEIGPWPLATKPLIASVSGITALSRVVVQSTNGSIGHNITIDSIGTGPDTFFEQYALGTTGTGRDVVTLNNIRCKNEEPAEVWDNTKQGSGVIRFQERNFGDNNAGSTWILNDCILESENNALFTGYTPSVDIHLRGNTKLTPGAAKPIQQLHVVESDVVYPDSQVIIDERSALPGTGGSGYAPRHEYFTASTFVISRPVFGDALIFRGNLPQKRNDHYTESPVGGKFTQISLAVALSAGEAASAFYIPSTSDIYEGEPVVENPVPGNIAPTVSLAISKSNAVRGENLVLTASPNDTDGTITKVEFYEVGNDTAIGTRTEAPWTFNLVGLGIGSYAYTARAYDNLNAFSTSAAVTANVIANQPPVAWVWDANERTMTATHPLGAQHLEVSQGSQGLFPNLPTVAYYGNEAVPESHLFARVKAGASADYQTAGQWYGSPAALAYESANTYDQNALLASFHADYGVTGQTWQSKGKLGLTLERWGAAGDFSVNQTGLNGHPAIYFDGSKGLEKKLSSMIQSVFYLNFVVAFDPMAHGVTRFLLDSRTNGPTRVAVYANGDNNPDNRQINARSPQEWRSKEAGGLDHSKAMLITVAVTGDTRNSMSINGGPFTAETILSGGKAPLTEIRLGQAFIEGYGFVGNLAAFEINNDINRQAALVAALKAKYSIV